MKKNQKVRTGEIKYKQFFTVMLHHIDFLFTVYYVFFIIIFYEYFSYSNSIAMISNVIFYIISYYSLVCTFNLSVHLSVEF